MKSSRLNLARSVTQGFCHLWLLFVLCGLLTGSRAIAQGTAFTYQGSLADGAAPANGTYDLRLTVFDAATGGSAVGNVTEVTGQAVADGLFTVTIDPGAGVFTGPGRWLELQVRTTGALDYTTIAPRQALTPTPYAISAASAATAATATVATTANSVPAAGITGTLPLARLPASVVVNGTNGLTLTPMPELVGQSSLAGGALSVLAGDHYAGIAAGNAGLLIFDVANPSAPALVSQFNQGVFTHGFTVDKDHAYLASGANGLRTFSLADIAAPVFLSETNDTAAHQLVTDGNYVYVAGVPNTVVYALTDRSHPEKVAFVGAASANPRRLALANTTLFLAGANALQTYSVATPASPVLLATVAANGAGSVAVSGNLAFVARGSSGVAVFDVADPANPTLLATVPADADAQHVYASANRLYVSDHGVGLQEWDMTAPAAPVHLRTFASVPDITGSIVLNNYAMTANSDSLGLRIVGLSQAVNFAAGHTGNGASGQAVGVTIGGGGARTYLVQNDQGEQNVGGPNVAGGDFSTIAGGLSNTVAQAAHGAVIAGGAFNTIGTNATVAAIGGGAGNRIGTDARNAVIAGGDNNLVGTNAASAFIGGGERNEIAANARGATIPGGFQNRAGGEYSFAAGQQAKADHRGAFVWADANGGDFLSTAENQFSVRARGGVRFETGGAGVLVDGQPLGASGAARLNGGNTFTGNQTVNGSVSATSFTGNGSGLTSLNAGNLFGTVADDRLSANVATRVGGNAFTGDQTVAGTLTATAFVGDGSQLTGLAVGNPVRTGSASAVTAQPNSTYLADGAGQVTITLPAAANVGDLVRVVGIGSGGWRVEGDIVDVPLGEEWTPRETSRGWSSVASSADGAKLVATVRGGQIYMSADFGVTWTARESAREWRSVASSADGSKLVAAVDAGRLFTSNDSGVSWTARELDRAWASVATSADGTKLVAAVLGGKLHTSDDSGTTWVAQETDRDWVDVASSADGSRLIAAVSNGQLFTSADSGMTWTARATQRGWTSVASSSDGTKLVALGDGQIHTSADGGATWVARSPAMLTVLSFAASADATRLFAGLLGNNGSGTLASSDGGVNWVQRDSSRQFSVLASSTDGTRLIAAGLSFLEGGNHIYLSRPAYPEGGRGGTAEFRYAGSGQWQPVNPAGLAAGSLTGTVSDARLSANVALRGGGNSFSGNQNISGAVNATSFNGSGTYLTSLNADNLTTGTVPEARLPANVALLAGGTLNDSVLSANVATRAGGNAFSGDQSVNGAVSATSFIGNGSALTSLNAASLAAGTVPDARLSANVPLLAAGKLNDSALSANVALRTGGNAFNGNQTVAGTVTATEFVGNGAGLTGLPGGNSVQVVSGASVAAAPNTTYVANSASPVTVTLPSTAAPGDWVRVSGLGTGGWGVSGDVTINPPGEAWTLRAYAPNPRSLASSADGTQLVAASFPGRLYTSADSGVTWIPREADRSWISVASAGDGSLLVAAVYGGQLYTSADQGVSWTARESNRAWVSVASVADGSLLVAAASGGQIYISTDRGVTWMARESNRAWFSLAAVADGSVLIAAVNGGQLHTSTDRGLTWTARESNRSWISVASAADGSLLVAATESLGQLHVSTDRGVTWVVRGPSLFWSALALSANGTRLIGVGADLATSYLPELRTSVDGGVTWTTRESGRSWRSVASSSDGRKLVAGEQYGALFTSVPTLLQGGQGDSVELRFTANGDWLPVAPNELNAANLSTGTLPDARLSANVPLLAAGKLNDAVFSTDVARRAGGNAFNGDQTVNGGRVGLGTTAPAARLHVKQQTDNGGFGAANDGIQLEAASGEYWRLQTQAGGDLVFDSGLGSGYAYISRNSGSFNITSDARFKRDVQPLGPLLDRVLALEPVTFRYLHAPADSPPVVGFIAQQVLPLFPEVVDEKDGQYAIGYDAFGPIAIGAIQELNTKLEAKLAAKDAEVAELKSRLEKLERLVNEKLGGGQ